MAFSIKHSNNIFCFTDWEGRKKITWSQRAPTAEVGVEVEMKSKQIASRYLSKRRSEPGQIWEESKHGRVFLRGIH